MTNTNETIDHGRYILDDDGNAIPEPDLIKWGQWLENVWHTKERQIGRTCINGVLVSTVFLGLDHAFMEDKPILWETIQFNGKQDGFMDRYHTREEAIKGHNHVCNSVRKRFAKKSPHWLDQQTRSIDAVKLLNIRRAELETALTQLKRDLK